MDTFNCSQCGKLFLRYLSTVRNIHSVFCSKKCYILYQRESGVNKGVNNPNYKGGKFINPCCSCGEQKDPRAVLCSVCRNKGIPIGCSEKPVDIIVLRDTIIHSRSIKDVAQKLGMGRATVSKLIKRYGINISYFVHCLSRPYTLADLKRDTKIAHNTVKKVLLENNIYNYECSSCGKGDVWQGKELTIELHHINGDDYDNRIENLQFLCPNCHSQTDTHRGRKTRGTKKRRKSSSE